MSSLMLYTRPDCHLCDEAAELIGQVAPGSDLQFVDIENDLALISAYGLSVPVLKRESDGQELFWPFDAAGLAEFLA